MQFLTKKYLKKKIQEPKPLLDEEYQKFYDSKKETLLKMKDGKELINFITGQTSTHNKDIASSFLCWTGIYGMKTSNSKYKFENYEKKNISRSFTWLFTGRFF